MALWVVGGVISVADQNYESISRDVANKTRTLLSEQNVNPVLTAVETHRIVSELSDQSDSIVPREQSVIPVLPAIEMYWEISNSSDQLDLILMLPVCLLPHMTSYQRTRQTSLTSFNPGI